MLSHRVRVSVVEPGTVDTELGVYRFFPAGYAAGEHPMCVAAGLGLIGPVTWTSQEAV